MRCHYFDLFFKNDTFVYPFFNPLHSLLYFLMDKLTRRQKDVLHAIKTMTRERGFPPSMREITTKMGLTSAAGIHKHINALTEKGYLSKEEFLSRSLKIIQPGKKTPPPELVELPIAGYVAAGAPIEAISATTESLAVPSSMLSKKANRYYVLRVKGESMIDDSIMDGDFVIVEKRESAENGEMVIALLEGGEATLKRYYNEGDRVRLQPSNPDMSPIYVLHQQLAIQGTVVGLWRKF